MATLEYFEKLALLASKSKNKGMINMLTRKPYPKKLDYELRKLGLLQKPKPEPKQKPVEKQKVYKKPPPAKPDKWRIVRNGKEIDFKDLPPELQKRWEHNRDNYKLIRSLHEKLKLMEKATEMEREPLVKEIISRDEQVRDNWKIIDAWHPGMEDEKQELSENDKSENDKSEIDYKRVNANRKYISKNLNRLNKQDKKYEYFRDNIQKRYNELKAAGIEMTPKSKAELSAVGIKI